MITVHIAHTVGGMHTPTYPDDSRTEQYRTRHGDLQRRVRSMILVALLRALVINQNQIPFVNTGKYVVFGPIVGSKHYGMVWYGMVWYGMVWYGMVRCAIWYGTVDIDPIGLR